MKKIASLIALAALVAGLVLSCAGGAPTAAPSAAAPAAKAASGLVLNENFDSWTGGAYYAKGDVSGSSVNDKKVSIGGKEALAVNGKAASNNGYGYAVEVQLPLSGPTDMSNEDYSVEFDVYVPKATYDMLQGVQFGLYDSSSWTPIYSVWFSGSIKPDQWVTIKAPIDTSTGKIDYSGFKNNPEDWILDVFRVQVIVSQNGADVLYYLDNVKVGKF